MRTKIILFLSKHFPWIIFVRQFLVAWIDCNILPIKNSYSQFGEDRYIFEQLSGFNLREGVYIDVGANQPTKLSNTFLFYKNKLNGIVLEPNWHHKLLFMIFRPQDIFLNIGAGSQPMIGKFNRSAVSVLSGFSSDTENTIKSDYVPILQLDSIKPLIKSQFVYLLSVDTEGYDLFVLKGGEQILDVTIFAIIESNSEQNKNEIDKLMAKKGFTENKHFGCNVIYINRENYAKYCEK